jgi:TonB-linked SusC/RagA family outer membrane protein
VLANAVFFNPNVPVYNEDGTYGRDPLGNGFLENPVMIANELTHNINSRRLISNIYGEISFLENLKFRSTFGIDFLTRREERFIPSYFQLRNGVAAASARFYEEIVWQNENTLQYNEKIDKHSFGALIGYSMLESVASNFNISGTQTASNLIPTFTAVNISQPGHNIGSWGLQSFFARANYSYDDKYLFEASIRRDGSSRFGRNNRFGYFPSISGAWRISAEPFMAGLENTISDLKLRASYGATGNQDGIDNFGSLTQYAANASYDGQPAVYRSAVGNPDLKWETTVSTNIGIDFSLFNNRLEVSADAYRRRTNDLFYSLALPQSTGFSQISRVNLGSLENKGIEFMFTSRNAVGQFTWTTNFNISFNRNKITELYEFNGQSDRVIPPINYSGVEGPYGLFRVGEPTGNFYGYRYLGIWGDANNQTIPEEWGNNVQLGDVRFDDVNENFRYGRNDDHQLIGNALPAHIGGITNSFTYQGFDLNIVMNWSYGNQIYNVTRATLEGMTRERNQLASVINRWSPENPNAVYPRPFYGSNSVSGAANTDANSRYVEDGSFLRVRNVTLGYNLPVNLLDRIRIANARVYVSGQNLLTFTNYSGLDPESQNLGVSQGAIPAVGVDYLTQGLPRVYMIGLNFGF